MVSILLELGQVCSQSPLSFSLVDDAFSQHPWEIVSPTVTDTSEVIAYSLLVICTPKRHASPDVSVQWLIGYVIVVKSFECNSGLFLVCSVTSSFFVPTGFVFPVAKGIV